MTSLPLRPIEMPAAIFDLDGTLIDSYDAHFSAWREISSVIGHSLSEEQFQSQFGLSNPPILSQLHELAGLSTPAPEVMAQLADDKEVRFRTLISGAFPIMHGVGRLLAELRDGGWKVAIGSSAPRGNIDLAIQEFSAVGIVFDAVACGCDVTQGKPAPDLFLLAASRLQMEPAACVVIEDAAAGVEGAGRAGMARVGLVSKGRTHDELKEADLVVDDLTELNAAVLGRMVAVNS